MSKWICSVLILFLFTSSCYHKDNQENNNDKPPVSWFQKSEKVLVVDSDTNQPILESQLLIGEINQESLWIKANSQGEILIPESWNQPETITVKAPNYINLTLFKQSPSISTLKLKKLTSESNLSLKGDITGVTTKDKDGY
ncbi:MAG: hypothetical protein KDD45_09600, partial [Bdellovibrionales bacterium]|nr:hypothetical protein [Bdellovibrionales bacterium]